MVTAQSLSVISPNCSRDRINQDDPRGDLYFRVSVARDQKQESVPQQSVENLHGRENGISSDREDASPGEAIEIPIAPGGLSYLPLAGQALADLEREAIRQTLSLYKGNRKQTAAILGISVRTLQRKIKDWNLEKAKLG